MIEILAAIWSMRSETVTELTGLFIVQVFGLIALWLKLRETGKKAERADQSAKEAGRSAEKAAEQTEAVSNGFPTRLFDRLDTLEHHLQQMQTDITYNRRLMLDHMIEHARDYRLRSRLFGRRKDKP